MDLEKLFKEFSNKKIIVLGDVMIDAYLYGSVGRVSPEAPVPIINHSGGEERLGGAANVALNLVSLGAKVAISSVVGNDRDGKTAFDLLKSENISTEGIVSSDERITTIKTRIIGNHQQLLRIDQEQTEDISAKEENEILSKLEDLLKQGYDAIIFQDYNKGVLTANVIEKAIALAKKYDVVTTVDPKLKNFKAYKGVTLFKPNLKELSDGMQVKIDFEKDKSIFDKAVEDLRNELEADMLFVTLSQYGVVISDGKVQHHIPAHPRNITDVSGAGDTVISVATLCLTAGLEMNQIAALANLAGGIVCEYRGVVALNAERFLEEAKKIQL